MSGVSYVVSLVVTFIVGNSCLNVIIEPTNVLQPAKSTILIDCIAKPSTDVQITWEKNSQLIPPAPSTGIKDGEVYVLKNNSLYIKSLIRRQTGTYTCNAFAIAERQFRTVKVEIAYLRLINDIPPVQALEGAPAMIKCVEPLGKPLPSVSWLFNGNPITSSNIKHNTWTLEIQKVGKANEGNYTCIAKNNMKIRSTVAVLGVVVPGEVVVSPATDIVEESQSTRFNCTSSADPPLEVVWKRVINKCNVESPPVCTTVNVDVVPEDQRIVIENGVLIISKTIPSDSGTYRCQTELSSQIDSKNVVLNVIEHLRVDSNHQYKQQRDTLRHKNTKLECSFSGDGEYTVAWKRLSPLKTLPSNMVVVNNTLQIKNLKFDDAGKYQCIANGDLNFVEAYVELIVYESPQFTIFPKNITAYVGDPVWVICEGKGVPRPKVNYLDEHGPLNESHFVKLPNNTLHIKSVLLSDSGTYYCWLTEKYGMIAPSPFTIFVMEKEDSGSSSSPMGRTVGIAVGCAGVYILLVIGLMIYCRARRARLLKKGVLVVDGEDGTTKDPLLAKEDIPMEPVCLDKWLFPRDEVHEIATLGTGKSGRVFKAHATGICEENVNTLVAVKVYEGREQKSEFDLEVDMFTQLNHENVVRLLGVVNEIPSYIITEYTEQGNLNEYLKLNADMTLAVRLNFCYSIAVGMEHLVSLRYIHRDLATRNCLACPNNTVKVSFFSLCENTYSDDYFLLNGIPVPLRWLAPEAVRSEVYSEKSDVWSFGVTMWEIFSAGRQPFGELSNDSVLQGLRSDLRLPAPQDCPAALFDVMQKCWETEVENRPTFEDLSAMLSEIDVQ